MGNQQSGDNVRMNKFLGRGAYAEVYSGYWRGKPVALKKLESFLFEGGDIRNRGIVLANLEKEWKILESLSHPNIVEYYTVILDDKVPPIIVTELCDCDLYHFIRVKSNNKVSFQDTVSIMSDVAEGLKYLHGLQPEPIVHRDLSSKNILLTKSKRAKITDFGLAKAFPHGAMYATVGVGTMMYAAPETYPLREPSRRGFAKTAYYTEKVDIFSFGALLLEVIVGHLPHMPLPDPLLEDGEVVPEYYRRSKEIEDMGLDHPLRSLVMNCLDNLPEDRPNAQNLVDFLVNFKSEQKFDFKSKSLSKLSLRESPPPYSAVTRVTKDNYDYNFKIAVLGDGGVGKTSIIGRFLHPDTVPVGNIPAFQTTIMPGDHFERLQYRGKSVHLHIVDTPGDKKMQNVYSVVPQIYRGVDGVAIIFGVEDRRSFNSVIHWLTTVNERSGQEIAVVLVGNKTDLHPRSWKVSSQEAEEFALKNGLFYIETSALGLINIDEIFCVLIQRIIQGKLLRGASTSTAERPSSPDWVFYQPSINNSLLKEDTSHNFSSSIVKRTKAQPLATENIIIGLGAETSTKNTTSTSTSSSENIKSGCRC